MADKKQVTIPKGSPKAGKREGKLQDTSDHTKGRTGKEQEEKKGRQPIRPGLSPIKRQGKKMEFKVNINLKRMLVWFLILLLFAPFLINLFSSFSTEEELSLTQLMGEIKEGKIEKIEVVGDRLTIDFKDSDRVAVVTKESQESLVATLKASDINPTSVEIAVVDQSAGRIWFEILGTVLPLVLMGLFFLFLIRQARGAQDGIMGFGRSKAKLFSKGKQDVSFKDVGGVKEAKEELEEVVDFLKHPRKYRSLGARTPKGVLLVGPSGTGKTLLARAVAGEASVPFFSMAGSEFMEMLVGVGASVTGDTPILIKKKGKIRLMEIGEFVDEYYKEGDGGYVVPIKKVETLGLEAERNKFWGSNSNKRPVFGGSKWSKVRKVYRHKVNQIYEIGYLGGKLRTTGDHSVFVREQGGIRAKEVRQLRKGDVLVNLPMNTRAWDYLKKKTNHKIKKHRFASKVEDIWLDVWQDDPLEVEKYRYVMAQKGKLPQYQIGLQVGVAQATVGNWHRGTHKPQRLSKKAVKLDLPGKVRVTPALCKLLGYYTAEGRGTTNLEFTFGIHERKYVEEVAELMAEVFGLKEPKLERTNSNSIRVKYYSAHLGRFFSKHCGNGSHNKYIPEFIWEKPKEYFLAYFEGYANGDGYIRKSGKLYCSSVSQRLIRELAWLCSMHGIKVGIKHEIQKAGRVINRKPLPETESWNLIVGKTSNPFINKSKKPYQFKRCIVREVKRKKYDGYVYDLCEIDNEAFFGGEKPILLHNSRVRDLFDTAKKSAPGIIFIDEIDAIGRVRGLGAAGGHDEREQTLNQILVEMDGFTQNDNVMVLAATNRGDLLDPALTRPGRFDRRIMLGLPDIEERNMILRIHAKGKPFAKGVDWDRAAKRTVGFSGADLENMLNEAAIQAARHNKKEISWEDMEEAATRVKLGPQKKRLQSEYEKKMTAYHEAGHAVVAHFLPQADRVHRVSIVSRGVSLGYTLTPPEEDKYQQTRSELIEQIAVLLGGRTAENLIFDELTGGAASDIDKATRIARSMVVDFGMDDELGPINFGPQFETSDYGRVFMDPTKISDELQAKVDAAIRKVVAKSEKLSQEILNKHKAKLHKVAKELIGKETLDGEEFEKIIGVKKVRIDGDKKS